MPSSVLKNGKIFSKPDLGKLFSFFYSQDFGKFLNVIIPSPMKFLEILYFCSIATVAEAGPRPRLPPSFEDEGHRSWSGDIRAKFLLSLRNSLPEEKKVENFGPRADCEDAKIQCAKPEYGHFVKGCCDELVGCYEKDLNELRDRNFEIIKHDCTITTVIHIQ